MLGYIKDTPVVVRLISGLLDGAGAAMMKGFSDSINDCWPKTLGRLDGIDLVTIVSVGSMLDWLDGWASTEGLAEGSNVGTVK